ncbi:MAG: hypothetical protein INR62_11145 [Rhodospirillales bacterium]|nr:hypothetical protein [Acetobacter sp.]
MIAGSTLTRIHGDLHLGQVLVCNGDVMLIDFEGEPAKPIEVRRGKEHPLRDVAGVIRSFDYAAAVVRRRSQTSHPHLMDDKIAAYLASFVQVSTDAFLSGYREQAASAADGQAPGLNVDLLDFFLVEKAAYEICYEAANRPSWIDVPLHGLTGYVRRLLDLHEA